ncbi:MAG: hypothetical protein QOD86_2247 [Miltoncostaeaceae bacterium]|nr:hypothetical protein [Miltoncostaeaceae bacterium]
MSGSRGGDRHRRHGPDGGRRTLLWLGVFAVMGLAVIGAVLAASRDEPPPPPPTDTTPALTITFPEGLRREDMARIVADKTGISPRRYLELTAPSTRGARLAGRGEPTSLEGFLFPATYEYTPETTAAELVQKQLDAYEDRTSRIDYRFARSKNLTKYDVLIIASMIEREVQLASERPLVASVIYNRLKAGMALGIDATVQYALGEWKPDLTVSDLQIDSPYNTRRYPGLPPGPIASPGEASLRAAAHPKTTDFLYYVARNDGSGGHYFARTDAEHQANIARARANG